MYVTDTHGFLWYILEDERLGKKASEVFQACDEGEEMLIIPSIVLLECMYICEKKRIDVEFREIIQKIQEALNYSIYPLDEEVVLACQNLSEIAEAHDRVIVATAKLLNAKLITKDNDITNSGIIDTIW